MRTLPENNPTWRKVASLASLRHRSRSTLWTVPLASLCAPLLLLFSPFWLWRCFSLHRKKFPPVSSCIFFPLSPLPLFFFFANSRALQTDGSRDRGSHPRRAFVKAKKKEFVPARGHFPSIDLPLTRPALSDVAFAAARCLFASWRRARCDAIPTGVWEKPDPAWARASGEILCMHATNGILRRVVSLVDGAEFNFQDLFLSLSPSIFSSPFLCPFFPFPFSLLVGPSRLLVLPRGRKPVYVFTLDAFIRSLFCYASLSR